MSQKGFALVLIFFLITAVILGAGYYFYLKQTNTTPTIQPSLTPADETANWKDYTSTILGISFKYPSGWYVIYPGNDGEKSLNIQNYRDDEITITEIKTSLSPSKIKFTIGKYDQPISSNQDLVTYLKVIRQYDSAMTGSPKSVEDINISNNIGVKLNYLNGPFYVFNYGVDVFYIYYTPENTQLVSIFNQILSTFKFY